MALDDDERDRLARIETKLDILVGDFTERVKDYEARLRGLERWRYALPTSLVLAAVSVAVSMMQNSGH